MDKYQRLVDKISARQEPQGSSNSRQLKIDPSSSAMIQSYLLEIGSAIIEEADLLRQLRGGEQIEAEDINLILGELLLFYLLSFYLLFLSKSKS